MKQAFSAHITSEFPELLSSKFGIAASAGLDSTVLVHLCHILKLDFHIIHVNFKLRNEESDADADFLRSLSAHLKCPITIKDMDAAYYAEQESVSIQVAARALRYGLFKKMVDQNLVDFVLTAHHLDDQLETMLMNLGRGAGLQGLSGIPSSTPYLRRPLLKFKRADLLDFAKNQNIRWREDASNASHKYLRNRLRHQVLPSLHQTLPELSNHLEQTFSYLKDARFLVDQEVNRFRESGTTQKTTGLYIDISTLETTQRPRAYLYELLKEYPFHIPDVLRLLQGSSGKRVLAGDMEIIKDRKHLILRKIPVQEPHQIGIGPEDGQSILNDVVLNLKVFTTDDPVAYVKENASPKTLFMDYSTLTWPLTLRTWEPGDRIKPFGMKGSKLISDLLTDLKVPLVEKENALVLTCENELLWLVGKRASRKHLVHHKTKKLVAISIHS